MYSGYFVFLVVRNRTRCVPIFGHSRLCELSSGTYALKTLHRRIRARFRTYGFPCGQVGAFDFEGSSFLFLRLRITRFMLDSYSRLQRPKRTRAPCRAKATAVARPIPAVPPVINTTLSEND